MKKLFKEELRIADMGSEYSSQQIKVVVNPKSKPKYVPDFDNIHVSLKSIHKDQKGELKEVWMTPDEALELANKLTTAVQAFLQFGYEQYDKDFNEPRRELTKKL